MIEILLVVHILVPHREMFTWRMDSMEACRETIEYSNRTEDTVETLMYCVARPIQPPEPRPYSNGR